MKRKARLARTLIGTTLLVGTVAVVADANTDPGLYRHQPEHPTTVGTAAVIWSASSVDSQEDDLDVVTAFAVADKYCDDADIERDKDGHMSVYGCAPGHTRKKFR